MGKHTRSTFEVKNWDEKTVGEVDGRLKITRASVAFAHHGELEAESVMEYLMAYGDDGSATVIGLERVNGRLDGKVGTFVLESRGGYADGTARADVAIVVGSGTGELVGIRGQGKTTATADGKTSFELEYDIDG